MIGHVTGGSAPGANREAAMSRLFTYTSVADRIITVLALVIVAMFVVVMFYHPGHPTH